MKTEERLIHTGGEASASPWRQRARKTSFSTGLATIENEPFAVPGNDVIAWVQAREHGLRGRIGELTRAISALVEQMRLAEMVQRSMLPRALPCPPGLEFAAAMRPTQYMAGDFYNAFRLDRDRFGLYLGDVMGHGPAAALLSVFIMQTLVSKRIDGSRYEIVEPVDVVQHLHAGLMEADFPGQPFVTLTYGLLDVANLTWSYCCGGHPPPLLLRPGEVPRPLEVNAPLLGVIDAPFAQSVITLQPGDRLILYTDGVDLVRWGDRGRGLKGFAAWLDPRDGRPLQALVDEAMASIDTLSSSPADDIAVLAVGVDG